MKFRSFRVSFVAVSHQSATHVITMNQWIGPLYGLQPNINYVSDVTLLSDAISHQKSMKPNGIWWGMLLGIVTLFTVINLSLPLKLFHLVYYT